MSIESYKKIIKGRMGEKRYIHSVNVAKQAQKLAKIYGCDEEKAMTAGILHDVTKETPFDEQLKIITEGGIILDEIEKSSQKLWHPISGSVYIQKYLDINDADITGSKGFNIDSNKYIPELIFKDKKLQEYELKLKNQMYEGAEKRLKEYGISMVSIESNLEVPLKIINLLERHRNANIR